jgi:hypothetical protein
VKLYLPRHHGDGALLELSSESFIPPRARQGETVLVVEDDPDVRTYTVEMVSDLGYQVISAPDGPTALQLLQARPELRLLFTDVGLPGGINGLTSPMRRSAGGRASKSCSRPVMPATPSCSTGVSIRVSR